MICCSVHVSMILIQELPLCIAHTLTMPAGADETKLTREALKWPYGEFEIPNEVYDAFGAAGKKGQALEDEWNKVKLVCSCSCCRSCAMRQVDHLNAYLLHHSCCVQSTKPRCKVTSHRFELGHRYDSQVESKPRSSIAFYSNVGFFKLLQFLYTAVGAVVLVKLQQYNKQ